MQPRGIAGPRVRKGVSWDHGLAKVGLAVALAVVVVTSLITPAHAGESQIELLSTEEGTYNTEAFKAKDATGSMYWVVNEATGASALWKEDFDGSGIDVAVIDSGVVLVDGLSRQGKVVFGPDFSADGGNADLRNLDAFGHGTHLAGIIAGRDDAAVEIDKGADHFVGMAPGSRLLSVKVADAVGDTSVPRVVAAIDWVVNNRQTAGLNVRVLSLSFGIDGVDGMAGDALAAAVERAWQAGVVVVVAAGNDGSEATLDSPANNPYVIAVGATDGSGSIAEFSSCGNDNRHVDIVAPGRSIVSLRNPGSMADAAFPDARVTDRLFAGSGTSQAAAIVSGGVALLLDQRPNLTPDQVKALIKNAAAPIDGADANCQGAGALDLAEAMEATEGGKKETKQNHKKTKIKLKVKSKKGKKGDIDSEIRCVKAKKLKKCFTIGGKRVDDSGASWSGASWSGASWSGASWSGASWSGASWSGASWSGASWS